MENNLKLSTILLGIGTLLIVLGIGISMYGFSVISPYHEKTFSKHESKQNSWGGRNDIANWLNVQSENDRRKSQARRSASTARPYIISGIVLAVLGLMPLIFGFIQRKNEEQYAINGGAINNKFSNEYQFCPGCGKKFIVIEKTCFCENCGYNIKRDG